MERIERPRKVCGCSYKLTIPTIDEKVYVTINNIEMPDGRMRPIEIFINSKNMESFQWVTALTRILSAVFRKPGNFLFIIKELQQVFDPGGGYFIPGSEGTRADSIVAHIGLVIEEHCRDLGIMDEPISKDASKSGVELTEADNA